MLLRSLILAISSVLITFSSFGQISAVHSTMLDMDLCADQTGSITLSNSVNYVSTDTISVVLPNNSAVTYNNFMVSVGNDTQSGDTIFIDNITGTDSIVLTYTVTLNCDAHLVGSYNLDSDFNFALNSINWLTLTSSFQVSSPTLNFIGGNQLNYNNALLGIPTARSFYYTNTNSSVPFTGVIEFRDTLPHTLSNTSVKFDTIYLASAGNVLDYDISDSTVRIIVQVSNLGLGDTIEIVNLAYLNDCILLESNATKFELNYGCIETDLCQTVANNGVNFKTTLNFDPNDKPIATLVTMDTHHEMCYSDSVTRVESFMNTGLGISNGMTITFQDTYNQFGLTFLDTNSIELYLNNIAVGNELSYTTSFVSAPNQLTFLVHSSDIIAPGETLIIVYKEFNKCIPPNEYDYYVNQEITLHDIRVVTKFLHPCFSTGTTSSGANVYFQHKYGMDQQFNNLTGTMADFQASWFEIENVGGFQIGNSPYVPQGIPYDINNSQIEVEILLESGLSLTHPDSVMFCSSFGGVTSTLPVESVNVFYGAVGSNQFDTVRAIFNLPSSFQNPNSNPNAHHDYIMSSEFNQFFANSSIKFQAKAYCDSVAPDSKVEIIENIYFIIDTNCTECKLPLAKVEDELNILCPGCILPGWNLTEFELERINLGYADINDDHYPDAFAIQSLASGTSPQDKRVMIGDTLRFGIEGFITDGDPSNGLTFLDLNFPFDEGQFLFKGDVGKLKFIGGSGIFIQGSVSTPFYVPAGSDDVYMGAIGIDMSINSLNNYGVTNISNYHDSCSIIFNPEFRVVDNYDDGLGINPFFSLQNITTFYLMGGNAFGAPDIIVDANITPIDTISDMTIPERENLSYWCVGFDGRFIGIGTDYTFYAPSFIKSSTSENNDCEYRMTERFLGIVGDVALIGAGANSTDPNGTINPGSSSAFPNELRDLYNLDSITYHFPMELEVYDIQVLSHSYYLNQTSFLSNWSPNNAIPYTPALYSSTPTSVTIYPELFQHSNTQLTTGDNHGTYDENVHYQPTIFLRNKACYNLDTIPILNPFIDNHFSNFPGTLTGDTTISVQMSSTNHSTGVGANNNIDLPNPTFLVSANSILPQSGSNVGFEIDYSVVPPLPYSNLTHLLSRTNDIAYNSFMAFQSPSGNFTNITVPIVDNTSTNYSTLSSTTTSGPPVFTNTVAGNLLVGTETLGGDSFHYGYSKKLYLFGDYDCASLPPGGTDSLYLIYGWNCFDYPDTLENACFLDTFVLYITMPNTGLNVNYGIQDSISLCDTINFSTTFEPTGFGEVNNVTVEIFNDNNQAIDYIPSSGLLNYDSVDYIVDPVITSNSYLWILDSITAGLQNFNELSPVATFYADLKTACGLSDDTLMVVMSGTNYCGQIIYQDTFEITPETFYDLPVHDSLSMSGTIDSFTSCSDTNTVTISVNNDGQSSSNTNNELQIVIPDGYDYVSGGSPSYNSNDTLILPISTSIVGGGSYPISIEISKTDSTCQRSDLTSQLILNSPYYCDTNECFYSSTTPNLDLIIIEVNPGGFAVGTIDPSPICSGIDEIIIDFTSLETGTIEVYDASTSTYLGQGNYPNTSGTGGQLTISLSDSSSNLFFINTSPCCPDTIYYSFDCDTICQADASFDISDYCLGDTINVTSSATLGTHEWTYNYFGLTAFGSSASFPAAQAGSYSIQHIFNATCGESDTVIQTFIVNMAMSSSIVLNGTNPICQPDSILLSIQNGANFTDFLWTNGATTPSIWVSTSGTYGVSIVDSNGCSNDCQAITISAFTPPIPTMDTIHICDPLDSVDLDAGNYPSIDWNTGSSNQMITVVGPGQYTATVCDSSGTCCATNTYTVILSEFTFDIPDTISCDVDSTLITTNFTANAYNWSNGNIGNSSYYLADGTHWLTATNEFSCAHTDSFTVSIALLPISDFTISDTICTSDSITCLYPTIDDPSFNHHWIFDFAGSQYHNYTASPCFDFGNIGTFPITHIVTNSCGSDTTTLNVTIIEFDPTANIIIIGQNPFCLGDSVQLTPSSDFVSIEWHDGIGSYLGNQDTLTVFSGGIYAATITDSNGCTRTILTTINENTSPSISLGVLTDPTACNSSTGSIEVTGSGTGTISWSGTSSGSSNSVTLPFTISGLNAGSYSIAFTVNGCPSNMLSAALVDPPLSNVITSGTTTICEGDSTTISASGASTYSWDNGAGTNATAIVSPTSTITYTVTGTSNGCTSTDQVIITVVTGSSSNSTITICPGDSVVIGSNTYDAAGTYIDSLNAQNGCDSIVNTTIQVFPDSSYTQNYYGCEGDTVTVFNSIYTTPGTYMNLSSSANGCDYTITTVITFNPTVHYTQDITICEDSSIMVVNSIYNMTGTYIDSTLTNVGCDSIITTNLTVLPSPSVSIEPVDTICIKITESVELIGSPPNGMFSGPGVSSNVFYPNSAGVGSHTITYTYIDDDTGCEGMSSITIVVEDCAGVDEYGLEGVSLFPNPNDGIFVISGLAIGTEFEIIDSRGRLVADGITKSSEHEIELTEVEKGIYYLYATQDGVRGSLKFLIMK